MIIQMTESQALLWIFLTCVIWMFNLYNPILCLLVAVPWPGLFMILFSTEEEGGYSPFRWLGVSFSLANYTALLSGLAIQFLLFTGPLINKTISEANMLDLNLNRNVIMPIVETILLRMCIVLPLVLTESSIEYAIAISAIISTLLGLIPVIFNATNFRITLKAKFKFSFILKILTHFIFYLGLNAFYAYVYSMTASFYTPLFMHAIGSLIGIPDLTFVQEGHENFQSRWVIVAGYQAGLIAFTMLLPLIMNPNLFSSIIVEIARSHGHILNELVH